MASNQVQMKKLMQEIDALEERVEVCVFCAYNFIFCDSLC